MKLLILASNIFGWPLIHLALARYFLRLPDSRFARDSWLTRIRGFEESSQLYRRLLAIQRWKGLLPVGAPWLGGRSKKRVGSRTLTNLRAFAIETRRAEAAHWCMLLCTPVFFLWNPMWACAVMTFYGLAANLPCILVQRANRMKVAQILNRPNPRWADEMRSE